MPKKQLELLREESKNVDIEMSCFIDIAYLLSFCICVCMCVLFLSLACGDDVFEINSHAERAY